MIQKLRWAINLWVHVDHVSCFYTATIPQLCINTQVWCRLHVTLYTYRTIERGIYQLAAMTTIRLPSGAPMPLVGLGTWKSKPGEVAEAVKCAIEAGYRHIDCAAAYCNEEEVGSALKEKLGEACERGELFVTSKLWNTFHHPDDVRPACLKTLKDLGLSYLDLYLIHWPTAFERGGELFPKDPDGKMRYADTPFTDTWKEMEKLVEEGLCRHIGLSNFNSKQIDKVCVGVGGCGGGCVGVGGCTCGWVWVWVHESGMSG